MTSKPSLTNCPKVSCREPLAVRSAADGAGSFFELLGGEPLSAAMLSVVCDMQPHASLPVRTTVGRPERPEGDVEDTNGGYCGGVPPLPIPNREVKPTYADGTAMRESRKPPSLIATSLEADASGLLSLYLFSDIMPIYGI